MSGVSGDDVQQALRRSQEHLAAAQRITHCGSWELDLSDLVHLDANPLSWSDEVFRIFGYEPGAIEVTNENFFRAVHPDDRSRIVAAVRAALETGAIYSIDHRVIRPDGSVRIVHEESEIQHGPDGKPLKMIGTVQDITEQRMTEAQLVSRDRMASVGTLAAGVAHEINNPLTAVCANLELLGRALSRLQVPRELHENVRDAKDGADRVRAIVRDLMLFSRVDDRRTTPTEVKSVLESALRLSAHEYKHHAEIVRDYQEIPYAAANEARLGQVFLNLLRNAAYAIRMMPRAAHEIRVATRADARGRIVVTIADTGGGIAEDVQSRLFTPFFSTKPVGEGTGLGLSICQRIVSDLGGEISFASEHGRGTEFRVVLPPAGGELDEVTAPPLPPPPQPRRRILIIDDEELITSALQALLSDEHEVLLANDPASAREAFATGESYDVILCDLMMPGVTGMQLHAELGATAPALAQRMIFMTGGTFSDEARAFLKTGVRQIEKPFAVNELRKLIAEAISH